MLFSSTYWDIYRWQQRILGKMKHKNDESDANLLFESYDAIMRVITDQSLFGLVVVQDGRLRFVSRAIEDSLGYSAEELLALGPGEYLSLVHPEDRVIIEQRERENTRSDDNTTKQYTYRVLTKSGQVRWFDVLSEKIQFDGKPAYFNINTDITERMHAEIALRQSERRFREVAETVPVGIDELDRDGRIEYVNPAYCKMCGFERAEIEGTYFWNRTTKPEALRIMLQRLIKEQPVPAPWFGQSTHKSGRQIDIRVDWDYHRDDNGDIKGFIAAISDITEQKKLEAQLLHAQKMEAIGTLAGGVAHDFNNLLTPVLALADMLENRTQRESWVYEASRVIKDAVIRATELAKQLLGFARKGKLLNTSVDMHKVVNDTVALLGSAIDRRITISSKLEAAKPLVAGDPGQLQQIVMNLAVNARDAMPEGGNLEFTTDNIEVGEEYAHLYPEVTLGNYVTLSVSDTGTGISNEIRQRIFEPFFTTKSDGKGTGMGLAMVYGIVKNHDGWIKVQSEVGIGTTFTVYLPLASDLSLPIESNSENLSTPGSGTVLVVDDEQSVRHTLQIMLESLGYRVLLAENGRVAIDVYQKRGPQIDLLILDLTMPETDGMVCFDRIREIDPIARVVVATGHAFDEAAQKLLDKGAKGFLQKPFVVADLSLVVNKALSDCHE